MNAYVQCLCFLSLAVKRQSGCDKIVMLQVHIEVADEFKLAPRYLLKISLSLRLSRAAMGASPCIAPGPVVS
jgi:hypothetical protein